MKSLKVSSSDFESGGWIPNRFSGYGEDVSPEIRINGISESAVSLIITLDDMGHPLIKGYNHWVAWNLPPVGVIPSGLPKGAECKSPFSFVQGLAYGKHCYRGPKPPFNWNHDYLFTVYALDICLSISPDSDKAAVLSAAHGHILQSGELLGKYQRRHG